jgi:phage-related protein
VVPDFQTLGDLFAAAAPDAGPERALVVAYWVQEIEHSEDLEAARHLHGEIYEVRASTSTRSFRVLFASEGAQSQVLLSLVAFAKKTQRTPPKAIELAKQRLSDWRSRARSGKSGELRWSHSVGAMAIDGWA